MSNNYNNFVKAHIDYMLEVNSIISNNPTLYNFYIDLESLKDLKNKMRKTLQVLANEYSESRGTRHYPIYLSDVYKIKAMSSISVHNVKKKRGQSLPIGIILHYLKAKKYLSRNSDVRGNLEMVDHNEIIKSLALELETLYDYERHGGRWARGEDFSKRWVETMKFLKEEYFKFIFEGLW